jgi:hypothetical protein
MQLDAFSVVAYFLSRFTVVRDTGHGSKPPATLQVTKWDDAMMLFFPRLRGEKSAVQFRNSLKTRRERVDPFFPGGRVGWYQYAPSQELQDVIDTLASKSEAEILTILEPYICFATLKYSVVELDGAINHAILPCTCCVRRYGESVALSIEV